ncbi:hypothetical protein [Vibrio vulnificus YJ016]|uniref:Uncharacterized protein n=1 Tax=Vibrio vulnificus (strain YJ016) TaxID=196600 RepID=Q7MKW7_VIBVY|nr:hypothetical protein [Vibrio vulnificus YJ016]
MLYVDIIYRDQKVCHFWHHANHLTNTNERPSVDKDILPEIYRLSLPCSLGIVLVLGDHAFVSS